MTVDRSWKDISNIVDKNNKDKDLNRKNIETMLINVHNKDYENILYLIENGVNINSVLDDVLSPMIVAIKNKDEEMLVFLLNNGANINLIFDNGKDALYYAIENGLNDICHFLIKNGAIVKNYRMIGNERTRLINAVIFKNLQMVKEVLKIDIKSINRIDNMGRTALHYNCLQDPFDEISKDIMTELLNANIDKNIYDNEDFLAFDYLNDTKEIDNIIENIELKQIPRISEELRNKRIMKQSKKEQEFIDKDVEKIFQPKLMKPKSIGRMRKIGINK